MSTLTFSKVKAAGSQLDSAIKLFFENGDPISIITLSGASDEISGCFCDSKWVGSKNSTNMFSMMLDLSKKAISPSLSKVDLSQNFVNRVRNWSKHADADRGESISFDSEQVTFSIVVALASYQLAFGEGSFSESMKEFELWFRTNRPSYLRPLEA